METESRALDSEQRLLLLEISNCPIVSFCLNVHNAGEHPCSAVVEAQPGRSILDRQVPEPWNGNLRDAKLLFLSTNPSFGMLEEYPTGNSCEWPDERTVDFFTNRFGCGSELWTLEGRRARQADGSFAKTDGKFWSQVAGKARDVLGREDVRGVDWALTEVVHCKSLGGEGVAAAADFCAERYLLRILHHSAAKLILCLGRKTVWPVVQRILGIDPGQTLVGPIEVAGSMRYVAFLEHPSAGSLRLSKQLSPEKMREIRAFIAA